MPPPPDPAPPESTTTVSAALARLALGWAFAAAALWWVLSTQTTTGPVVTVLGRQLTKADLPALPLVVAGGFLSVLAVIGRRSRPAAASMVLLSMFGVSGWVALWWLAIEPTGDGSVIAPLSPSQGITESDVIVIPTVLVAAASGLGGLIALWQSASPYRAADAPDAPVPLQSFFGSAD